MSQAALDVIVRSIPAGVVVFERNGRIAFVNDRAIELYGVDPRGLELPDHSTKLMKLLTLNGEIYPPNKLPATKALLNGAESKDDLIIERPDGSRVTISASASPIFDKEGNIIGAVGIFVDITERKKAEDALRKSELVSRRRAEDLAALQVKLKKKATEVEEYATQMERLAQERLEKLKDAERLATLGQVAGMVEHDIRNPLQTIISDVYMAISDIEQLSPSAQKTSLLEGLKEIEESTEYINRIVADLQDYAKMLKPVAKETDLEAVCNQVLSKREIPAGVDASCRIEADVKTLMTDPDLLKRILTNLVSNAVHAMPKGGKLVVHAFKDGREVVLTVKDTGVGIADDAKSKLFAPLFTTRSKGQGFGLPIVKRMTEALGGTVTLESQVGKGTTFIVHFPFKN